MIPQSSRFTLIMQRIVGGDANAMHDFWDMHGRLIYVTTRTFGVNKSTEDEIIAEVLIKVWKSAKKLLRVKNPEKWIINLTQKEAKICLKAKHRNLKDGGSDGRVGDGNETLSAEQKERFNYYLKFVSKEEQDILIYSYIQNLSFDEIGEIIGKSPTETEFIYECAHIKIRNMMKL